ncbi:copper amine oxidase N-terminal domain-containing protein [Thermoanaerobacter sp. RKWS2]|uniref:copper amine oxidase N-terminal domain-containing protein n=1 Tax=Thermoanaerobacter sp. RKWS2 TaxID=2983842 RepID=UPI00224B10FD|nr:copper amine oxidase N-terminal domain-containing protein [Thermoanaerobacter sp. RKWS2]UZQ81840.1 copper amine oxidase N-terminal domain-containing protein [Thermoanaerobacter sp. RKWS2]
MKLKTALKIILVFLVAFSLAAPTYMFIPSSVLNRADSGSSKFMDEAYAASSVENVNPSTDPVRVAKLWIGRKYFIRNAEKFPTDIAPYIDKNDRTLVPLRFIAYALGLGEENVVWNEQDQTVTIKADITFPKFYTLPQKTLKRTLVFKIGSPEFTVDGQTKTMDTVPVLVDSRTMLPARFVAENLGYEVLWNEQRLDVTFVPKIDTKIQTYIDYSKSMMGYMYPVLEGDPLFDTTIPYYKKYSTFPDDVKILNSIVGFPIFRRISDGTDPNIYPIDVDGAYNNLRFQYSVIEDPKKFYYGHWITFWIYHDYQPGTPQYDRFPKVTLDNFDYYVKPLMAVYFPDNYEEITQKIKNIFINSPGKMPQFDVYSVSDEKHPPYLNISTPGADGRADPVMMEIKTQN